MTDIVTPDGEIVVREPDLPVLLDTLGEDRMYAAVTKALAYPGAIALIKSKKNPNRPPARHVTFIGNALIASMLGVSVSTRVESRMGADGEIEYVATGRVLGPNGSMVEADALFSMADARTRPGGALDRGQAANLASTRAFNRVMKTAFSPYIYAPRPDGKDAPAQNTVDDADAEGMMDAPPPFESDEEAEAAAGTFSEMIHAAKGDKDQVTQIHGDATRRGLRWDKESERYFPVA